MKKIALLLNSIHYVLRQRQYRRILTNNPANWWLDLEDGNGLTGFY